MSELQFRVVVNDEGQYSLLASDDDDIPGWASEGMCGSRAECLAHIDRVWTDMRPASLRSRPARAADALEPDPPVDGLVAVLTNREHPIVRSTWTRSRTGEYVHLRFATERGETELKVHITSTVDGATHRRVEGTLILDFVPVTCVAELDPRTGRGSARLQRRA